MFKSLMTTRRFAPLFWCQFFSAFSDNFLKNALVFLILFRSAARRRSRIAGGGVFIAPYFFLSGLGGEMADRYDKAVVAQRLKLAEIRGRGRDHRLRGPFVRRPVRRAVSVRRDRLAVRPDQVRHPARPARHAELPAANALVEGATFLAILLGTIVGGMAAKGRRRSGVVRGLMLVFALLCWRIEPAHIPKVGRGAPT